MSVSQTQIIAAKILAEDIEAICRELETLVNGKEGFLKDLRKVTKDIGIQRFNEDVFLLKNLSKHVFEIINYIEQMNDEPEEGSEEDQYNRKKYNKSKSIY